MTGANSELGSQIIGDLSYRFEVDKIIATTRTDTAETFVGLSNVRTLPNVDLGTPQGSQELETAVGEEEGDQIYMVHCAGTFPRPELIAVSDIQSLERTLNDNFVSFAGGLRAVLPWMRLRHFGRILAFSTHTLHFNTPYFASFDASKCALESLVRTAANESAKYGIAINAFAIATLGLSTERAMKPKGDHRSWLKLEEVSADSINALMWSVHINGNVIDYWGHSDSFFGMSVMERNSLDIDY